jgi:hypothetical protein
LYRVTLSIFSLFRGRLLSDVFNLVGIVPADPLVPDGDVTYFSQSSRRDSVTPNNNSAESLQSAKPTEERKTSESSVSTKVKVLVRESPSPTPNRKSFATSASKTVRPKRSILDLMKCSSLLDASLVPDDIELLREFEDEHQRRSNFERIFPCTNTVSSSSFLALLPVCLETRLMFRFSYFFFSLFSGSSL